MKSLCALHRVYFSLDQHWDCAGLRITDARRFVGWAAGEGPPPAAPSDDEDEGGRPGPSSQPQLSTPDARRDSRPEPSTSGTRRSAPLAVQPQSQPVPITGCVTQQVVLIPLCQ